MKYTIEGFQQSVLVGWGLDATDAIILRYLVDFYHSGRMYHKIFNNRVFMWVYYQTIIDDLPIIRIASRRMIILRFKKYLSCGLMGQHISKGVDEYLDNGIKERRHGSYSYYCFYPEKLVELIGDAKVRSMNGE